MKLEFMTIAHWDESLWNRIEPVYREAFPSGAKPKGTLRSMLERGIACIHAGLYDNEVVAMAVSGIEGAAADKRLIIDYLAVRKETRGQGYGTQFLGMVCDWAQKEHHVRGIIIEVEAGETEAHVERIHFWERCGFILTAYVHQYIWVPEPYQAMLLPLDQNISVQDNGQSLFRYINSFHKKAYRQR